MKSKVFKSPRVIFELENVSSVMLFQTHLVIKLLGHQEYVMENSEDMANFMLWYDIYLEEKYSVEEVGEESVL